MRLPVLMEEGDAETPAEASLPAAYHPFLQTLGLAGRDGPVE